MMKSVYIGLQRLDGTEPPKESGYRRIPVQMLENGDILSGRQIAFPEVSDPGYGVIAKAAAYAGEETQDPLAIWVLPEALDVHEGVVPIIANGILFRGVEIEAKITAASADLCGTYG